MLDFRQHPSARLGKRRSKTLFQTAFRFPPIPWRKKRIFSQQDMYPRNISVLLKRTGNRMLLYHLTPGLLHFYFCSILLWLLYASFALFFIDINGGQAADYYRIGALDYFMVTTESQQA